MCTCVALPECGLYVGRNMDLDAAFGGEVVVTQRRYPLKFSHMPTNSLHFAFGGMARRLGDAAFYADAVNERGLYAAALRFGEAVYQAPKEHALASFEVIPYLLATCATAREAKEALSAVCVTDEGVHPDVPPTPLHFFIADKRDCLVAEPCAEGLCLFDDPFGVLTNSPAFPAQKEMATRLLTGHPTEGVPLPRTDSTVRFASAARLRRCLLDRPRADAPSLQMPKALQAPPPTLAPHAALFALLGAVAVLPGEVITDCGGCHYTIYSSVADAAHGRYLLRTPDGGPTVFSLAAAWEGDGQIALAPLPTSHA